MSEELSYHQSRKDYLKAYGKRYREEHKDYFKAYAKRYREEHKEELKAYREAYKETHKEELKAYKETHKEELKIKYKQYNSSREEYRKQYYINNRDKIIQSVIRCQKNNPSILLKQSSYKRGLGYLPLNNYFKGSHAHHLLLEDNVWFCVHIPAFLHSFFRHRSDTFKGMLTINAVALSYWLIDYQFFKDD